MTPEEVLDRYERLHGITSAMLQSARGGDWDNVLSLEQQCQSVLVPLVEAGAGPNLSDAQRQRKAQVLQDILREDAELRELTTSWMGQLRQILEASGRGKKVRQYYGKGL